MGTPVTELLVSFAVIFLGAKLFTNGVEWLGAKLNLTRGAVGSVLAAVGTALPESIISIVAVLLGGGAVGHEVGIGAILGAPFMLGTLALVITGVATITCRERADRYHLQTGGAVRCALFFLSRSVPGGRRRGFPPASRKARGRSLPGVPLRLLCLPDLHRRETPRGRGGTENAFPGPQP